MSSRKNTIVLANVLNKLAIDIKVESDIGPFTCPEVEDAYIVLLAAQRLVEHGVDIQGVTIVDGYLVVESSISLSSYKGSYFTASLVFDNDFSLIQTTASIVLDTPPSKEILALSCQDDNTTNTLLFQDIDIAMMLPIRCLLSTVADRVYSMLFNNAYDENVITLLTSDLSDLTINRAVCINGQAYTVIPQGRVDFTDPETGLNDLVILQALHLIRNYPDVGNLDLTFDDHTGLLCFDTE